MTFDGNIHGKPYQLKLNDMDCHTYCCIEFGASFGTQFGDLSIIQYKIIHHNKSVRDH